MIFIANHTVSEGLTYTARRLAGTTGAVGLQAPMFVRFHYRLSIFIHMARFESIVNDLQQFEEEEPFSSSNAIAQVWQQVSQPSHKLEEPCN
jgi:hypothetical protein